MSDVEQSLLDQNDVLRRRIHECLEANERANLVIASMADECAAITKAALTITTAATLEHLKNSSSRYPMP